MRLKIALALLSIAPLFAQSQSTELHIRYNSGQGVVPIYEGWERVPDGSFNMVFGYLNRNHVEELALPVGAQNSFEPGPDRGQPTYFYPRENHFLFRVNVPKDWDKKKEVVWTLTANGKTEAARATLLDVWEIDRKVEVSNNGGVQITNDVINRDVPPVVKIAPIARARAGAAVSITAAVSDDGIPSLTPAKPRGQRQLEPSLRGAPPSPVNVPLPARPRPVPNALSVLWQVYRGPAHVTFEPEGYVKVVDGKVEVKATFSKPGTYTIRAFGHDTLLRAPTDVVVNVDAAAGGDQLVR